MGAWGHGHFEDDSALDFMDEIEMSDQPAAFLRKTLEKATKADFLDADEGNAVIVAAAYVDRQLNGTRFTPPDYEEPLEVDTFPDRHPRTDLSTLRDIAVEALECLLGEESELNELWAENEEDYPAWRGGIEAMLGRLRR